MITPDDIKKNFNQLNIDKVSEFLKNNYSGIAVKYREELSNADILYMNSYGWKVELQNNEADRYGYDEWYLIEAL